MPPWWSSGHIIVLAEGDEAMGYWKIGTEASFSGFFSHEVWPAYRVGTHHAVLIMAHGADFRPFPAYLTPSLPAHLPNTTLPRIFIKDEAIAHVVRWLPPGWQQQRQQRQQRNNSTHSHLPAAAARPRPMRSQCEAKPKPNEKPTDNEAGCCMLIKKKSPPCIKQ